MRILLVPDPTSPNGEDAFCREIAKRAQAKGHMAAVQAVPNGPLHATLERLAADGFAEGADVVVVNSLQPAALLAARGAGKKTAVRLVDSYAGADPGSLAEVRDLVLGADALLVPSRHLASILSQWGANGKIREIPFAYDRIMAGKIALVTPQSARQRSFPLVAAAHFNEATRPGLETLISAAARLRIDCHLSLIGSGALGPALIQRAKDLGAESRVSFQGSLPHPRVMEYFRTSKAYVDPCGTEGFPTLALHALSEGCPVIGVKAGAVPELIKEGANGLLFSPGDAGALSEAVVTLSSVPGLSTKLIAEGVKTVSLHSWDATADAVLAAVQSL